MDQIWDSTLLELNDIIESKRRMEKAKAGRIFVLANAITSRIGYFFSDPKERTEDMILQPWQAYPEYFKNEKTLIEERREKQDMEIQRQKVLDRANYINALRKRREEGLNDC